MMRAFLTGLICALAILGSAVASAEESDAALWRGLASGQLVALVRHAAAPGTGDPPDFVLDDCATQRNLSAAGRDQARAIGDRFRAHGVDTATVRSSQWCRCLDTARLLDLGRVVATPALNSFFRNRDDGSEQTAAVRRMLNEAKRTGVEVLVTHQVNITALTNVVPSSGEIVVVKPTDDGVRVAGQIAPP